ncbi:MAG: TetR/AcrR family transcriptional regulator [Clostridia bacterium]|nr:TetR/AcrR family transcriptional regulator [Clostridia bacterium]
MPKVLECSREQMLELARKRFLECGYATFTVRDLAKDCGVSVGTIYTYFSSKEALLTEAMVEEWRKLMRKVQEAASKFPDRDTGFRFLYEEIYSFNEKYHGFCTRRNRSEKECEEGDEMHRAQLRQIASAVRQIAGLTDGEENLSLFIADAFLSSCNRGIRDYGELAPFIRRLCE